MNEPSREEIWEALSDLFIDNDVNYPRIAEKLAAFGANVETLEYIFFQEVAAFCGMNLLVSIPPVWVSFNREELCSGIKTIIQENEKSLMKRMRHKGYVVFLRWYFRKEWKEHIGYLALNTF